MAILEIFKKIAPEFKDMPDAEVEDWMQISSPFVSQKRFIDLYEQALAYYTAHMIKLSKQPTNTDNGTSNATKGHILKEKEGDLEVQYSDVSSKLNITDIELGQTSYGRQFIIISKRRRLPGITRMRADIGG